MLKVSNQEKEFIVCTDICQERVGGVLMHDGKVVAYESRKLKEHEKRYSKYELELTAMVHALKLWHYYLLGKKCMLMTYHSSLTSFFKQPNLNARQARSTAFLSDFDFDIRHLKGKENCVADALREKCIVFMKFGTIALNLM